jgi:UDPglucose--hexose-1-phosphate uridylyltransferase
VAYAAHREDRTFLPPAEFDPLAPTVDPANPTEVPAGPWDVAVFENLFPAFGRTEDPPPRSIVETAPAHGRCEVVVFTQDARSSLGALPLWHVDLILAVWAERIRELGSRDDVAYVFPFENRGVEVGVTLHHPHGQIYAYPFVPPTVARALDEQRGYRERTGRHLFADHLAAEIEDGRRMLYLGDGAAAFVPACARWSYECWIAPRRPVALLSELDDAERLDLARALKTVLLKLDGLWKRPMPYVMGVHQAPSRGDHAYAHAHLEIYPWLRMPGRLKYLAGSEVGVGAFTADTLPEQTAGELRAVEVSLD